MREPSGRIVAEQSSPTSVRQAAVYNSGEHDENEVAPGYFRWVVWTYLGVGRGHAGGFGNPPGTGGSERGAAGSSLVPPTGA